MLTLRRSVVGVLAVLLVSGVAWAQIVADIAAHRVQANAGNAYSQWLLGYYYRTGRGVPQDDAQAMAWYRKAADQGYAAAQFNLGNAYDTGQGVPQDYAEALRWYRLAANQGHVVGLNNLGVMYSHGRGVPQDYVEAHKWANLAASRATGDDRENFTEFRDDLVKLMTPTQLADAQRLAREWVEAFDAR